MLNYIKSEFEQTDSGLQIQNDAKNDYKTITVYAAKGKLRVSKSVKIHLRDIYKNDDENGKSSGIQIFGMKFKNLPLVPVISSVQIYLLV